MTTTHLARLVQSAMDDQNLSQGDVERRGGPTKQSLGRLLKHWRGERSLNPDTIPKLSTALRIPERTLGRAAAVDMGLLPADEAGGDGLARLTDALRESADEDAREVVVATAHAVWDVLKRRGSAGGTVTALPKQPPAAPAASRAARKVKRPQGKALRAALDKQAETPPPLPDDEP